MKPLVHAFLWSLAIISFGYVPKSGILVFQIRNMVGFGRCCQQFSRRVSRFTLLPAVDEDVSFPPSLPTLWIVSIFSITHSSESVYLGL